MYMLNVQFKMHTKRQSHYYDTLGIYQLISSLNYHTNLEKKHTKHILLKENQFSWHHPKIIAVIFTEK